MAEACREIALADEVYVRMHNGYIELYPAAAGPATGLDVPPNYHRCWHQQPLEAPLAACCGVTSGRMQHFLLKVCLHVANAAGVIGQDTSG